MATLLVAVVAVVALVGFTQPSDPQLAALTRMMTTVNAGDAAGYARLYAPDAVITIYGTGALKGRAAIEAHEVDLLRQFPGARLAFSEVWQDGPRAVVRYAINARTPKGPMGHDGLLFFRFDASGAIIEEHRYVDSFTPMAQLGALVWATAFRAVPTLPAALTAHAAAHSPAEKTNGSLVTTMLAAMHGGRTTEALTLFAADATIDEIFLPQPFTGKDAPAMWLKTWAEASPGMTLNITTLLTIGDFVLVEGVARGQLSRSLGLMPTVVPASTRPFEVRRGYIVRVGNGKITSLVAFMNGKEMAEAVGSWPIR